MMLCRFPPLVLLCVLVVPRCTPADEEPEVPQRAARVVPITSLQADIRGLLQFREHLRQMVDSDDADLTGGTMFQLLEMAEKSPVMPDAAQPRCIRYETYSTIPPSELAFDIVLPGGHEELLAALGGDDAELEEPADGILMVGHMPCVFSEHYLALAMTEDGVVVEGSVARLRKLLTDTETRRGRHAISITSSPRQIGRSLMKPWLDSRRAIMLTQAQRRDNEAEVDYLTRTLQMKGLVGLFDAIINDTENVEYSLDFSEHDLTSVIELRITAARDSVLDQYISRCRRSRSRAIRWLHSDHQAFAALALPLPELLRTTLPPLAKETLLRLQQELRAPGSPGYAAAALLDQFIERDQLECLVQIVPVPEDGTMAEILIFPLDSASTPEFTVIQPVSAVSDAWELSVDEIAGWPVNRLRGHTEFLTTTSHEDNTQLHWMMTDRCVAVWIGTEESQGVLEQILVPDGAEDPVARRFGRAAFAAATNGHLCGGSGGLPELPDRQATRLKENGPESLDDSIEIVLQTEPQTLSLTATFRPDAAFVAAQAYEAFFVSLVMLLENQPEN